MSQRMKIELTEKEFKASIAILYRYYERSYSSWQTDKIIGNVLRKLLKLCGEKLDMSEVERYT